MPDKPDPTTELPTAARPYYGAYYYGFDATGCDPVDKILEAVAAAGKMYHRTENWTDRLSEEDPSPCEMIQRAAEHAAEQIHQAIASKPKDGFRVDPAAGCRGK